MPKLKIAQHVKLHHLVHEQYTSSNKTDQEFAVYASTVLGFPVTWNHILECRRTYNIESKRARNMSDPDATIAERLERAEDRIARLWTMVTAMEKKWSALEGN